MTGQLMVQQVGDVQVDELRAGPALEGVDEAVLAQIKVDLFKQFANTELGFVRGIPQSQFMKEVDRMSPGFTR